MDKHSSVEEVQKKGVHIGEHFFELPPVPPKKEILFSNLPKKEQYWQREILYAEFPKEFFAWERGVVEDAEYTKYDGKRLVSLSVKDTAKLKDLRDREITRMQTGIWFMNDGESTYLTGSYYGVLMWCAMSATLNQVETESLYGQYMQFQRDYTYFVEILKTTKIASGGDVVKPKKTGITMLQCLIMLVDAIISKDANYRMMSTKEDVAKSINFAYILYAIRKLPEILKPEYRNNLGAIYFEDTGRGQRQGGRRRNETDPLNNVIETVATSYNGFDSGKNKVAWIDEQSKIKLDAGKSLTTLHNTTLPTVNQGFIRVGYIIYTHYVSENNDKSFRDAKKIYYDSKLKTIDPTTGQTRSGLLCYAMLVTDGVFGACDKYGKPEVNKIWQEINAQREARKDDPTSLRSYRRQMPTKEDDCWQEGAGEASIFDNLRLGMKLHDLTQDESTANFAYTDFNFRWSIEPQIDEIKNIYKFEGIVQMTPVTIEEKLAGKEHGKWRWYMPEWTPEFFLNKHTNKVTRDKRGKLTPNTDSPFYISIDPTQYSGAADVSLGSNNAMHVFMLPNPYLDGYFNKKVSNKRLMVEYLYRADSPKDTLMHVVQTILYFGAHVLIECNANWLATRLIEWGFENFLIRVNEETNVLEPWNSFSKQKKFTSQKSDKGGVDTIGDYISAGIQHINETGVDNVEVLYSDRVIRDLMNFEPDNTKEYDSAVAYLIGLLGINTYLGWRQRESDKQTRKGNGTMRSIFRSGLIR